MLLCTKTKKTLSLGFITCLGLISVACAGLVGEVPSQLRVDSGIDPDKQDEYVRFRTTYYFRVVDSCKVEEGVSTGDYELRSGVFRARQRGLLRIVNDSLYRFRMTGQASALFDKVRFESGVLRAEQIDPFGAAVVYDSNSSTFRVEPANSRRENAQRDEVYTEIERLRKLSKEIGDNNESKLIQSEIATLIRRQLLTLSEGANLNDGASSVKITEASLRCPNGRPAKRSYYLYGPEGVRQLDPDERLLMAMSSDSKPVISLLQQLSNKQLKQQGKDTSARINIQGEQKWISDSQKELSKLEDELKTDAAMGEEFTPQEIVNRLSNRSRTP